MNKFKGYRYRRYAVVLIALGIIWLPYAASMFFIYPSTTTLLIAIVFAVGVSGSLFLLAANYLRLADEAFKSQLALTGVVSPFGPVNKFYKDK